MPENNEKAKDDISFDQKLNDNQFTMMSDREKKQILTYKKLETSKHLAF